MSRGPGSIQTYTITRVAKRQGMVPVVVLAQLYARKYGVPFTPHLRSSFRRAANRLVADGTLVGGRVRCPTRKYEDNKPAAWRWVLCVAPPGDHSEDELVAMGTDAAQAMYLNYYPD
jgi:hypothetical protein